MRALAAVATAIIIVNTIAVRPYGFQYCNVDLYVGDCLVVDEDTCTIRCLREDGKESNFTEYNDDFFKCSCIDKKGEDYKGIPDVCFGFTSSSSEELLREDICIADWDDSFDINKVPPVLLNSVMPGWPGPNDRIPEISVCNYLEVATDVNDQESCLDWCGEYTLGMFVSGPSHSRCECFTPLDDDDPRTTYDFVEQRLAGPLKLFKMCIGSSPVVLPDYTDDPILFQSDCIHPESRSCNCLLGTLGCDEWCSYHVTDQYDKQTSDLSSTIKFPRGCEGLSENVLKALESTGLGHKWCSTTDDDVIPESFRGSDSDDWTSWGCQCMNHTTPGGRNIKLTNYCDNRRRMKSSKRRKKRVSKSTRTVILAVVAASSYVLLLLLTILRPWDRQ